jgi:hypothetical protein
MLTRQPGLLFQGNAGNREPEADFNGQDLLSLFLPGPLMILLGGSDSDFPHIRQGMFFASQKPRERRYLNHP